MMKSNLGLRRLAAVLLLSAASFATLQGCKGNAPGAPVFATPPPAPLANNIIDNFEDGNLLMNISLAGAASSPTTTYVAVPADPLNPSGPTNLQPVVNPSVPLGVWVASSWGGNTVNNPYIFTDGLGALSSLGYIHLVGNLTEPNPPAYASYQLEGKFNNGAAYDAATPGFTGIRFYYKLGATDNCLQRRFMIAVRQSLPGPDGGTCPSNCYDHPGADQAANPRDTWVLKSYTFTSLTQLGWGYVVPGGLPAHRTDFIKLVWINGRNGAAGTSKVDYYVDQVEFF
jgi:hypothetical protein